MVSITALGMDIKVISVDFCGLDVFVRGVETLKLLSLLSEGLVASNTKAHHGPNQA